MQKNNSKNIDFIRIQGASENNLKNINVDLPRFNFIVITGLSGSGKSSLAFNTIYAEGQRRYIESLSSYARQFINQMQKPTVESIVGLTPTIAIEQKKGQSTPRSIVATTTEIYDYLRILFSRIGKIYCPTCQHHIQPLSPSDISRILLNKPEGTKITIFAPLIRGRKGENKDILQKIKKEGFVRVRIDNTIYKIDGTPQLKKNITHTIEVVIDRVLIKQANKSRLAESLETALRMGKGLISVETQLPENSKIEEQLFSEHFACPHHGIILAELSPRIFSFNSPFGACNSCNGLGNLLKISEQIAIDPERSLDNDALIILKKCGYGVERFYSYNYAIQWLCKKFNIKASTLWKKIPTEIQKAILYGSEKHNFEGVFVNLENRFNNTESESQKERIHSFMNEQNCLECNAKRLKKEILSVYIQEKNIWDITEMTVEQSGHFFRNIKLKEMEQQIADPVIKTILERLQFLADVGLSYLTLHRATNSLSGGEFQRIRLASQLGSQLSGVTYVLDEPTIGLHQRDNQRLIKTLHNLKASGNTIIVVEHDEEVIRSADWIIDIGPGSGVHGGEVVFEGNVQDMLKAKNLTAQYIRKEILIGNKSKRTPSNNKDKIVISGCKENNLKNVEAKFPLGKIICVTGVSGSGKSTLITHCLYKALLYKKGNVKTIFPKIKKITGYDKIEKIIYIDQSPIGKTPRSNPATYTGAFTSIRDLMSLIPLAKEKGYKAGRFSFNVKGGRCEACMGMGTRTIEMHFLPNVQVKCDTCNGQRFNEETLQITYREKNITDILNMTVEEAADFFVNHPHIHRIMSVLRDVGLEYICLGQSATTFSGGEAQRIKLATELAKRNNGTTLYIMDEPTTGLHFHDINKLLNIIYRLVELGNTVIIIEHNMHVIKCADWVIDLGPEGGTAGGEIIAVGTPKDLSKQGNTYTSQYLRDYL